MLFFISKYSYVMHFLILSSYFLIDMYSVCHLYVVFYANMFLLSLSLSIYIYISTSLSLYIYIYICYYISKVYYIHFLLYLISIIVLFYYVFNIYYICFLSMLLHFLILNIQHILGSCRRCRRNLVYDCIYGQFS